jgi:hypothetical protein
MDEQVIREHARAHCDALVAGDIDRATEDLSKELRQHLGEVLALLPLPMSEAEVESIDRGGSSYSVVLRLVGETDEIRIQTRWKDRDGRPTIVEASHLSKRATEAAAEEPEADAAAGEDERGADRERA